MIWLNKLLDVISEQLNLVQSLSIKKLMFLGFTLVAIPLVIALLFSANQVSQLSKQGASSIFTVAELINTNQKLSSTLKKMQRYAGQYIVLQEKELMDNYSVQYQLILITTDKLEKHEDQQLQALTHQFSQVTKQINQRITTSNSDVESVTNSPAPVSLEELQDQFKSLIVFNEKINERSSELVTQQAEKIRIATEDISHTLLKNLFIIPVSLLIAGLFIVLITKPLKQLIVKIQRLQQGNFQQSTDLTERPVSGFIEIKEINDALDTMRTRLHALELQKSSFIRHISHELKTPLAAIREGTELLYDNSVGQLNDEQQEITKIIRNSTTRLQQLIEALLDFNIVLDSTSLQDKETINLRVLIEQVLNDRTLDIKRKQLTINKKYSDLTIESNAKQLTVIIDNLLSNAIKYSPEQGQITIHTHIENHQLTLLVSDQGEGIQNEQQEKVFDAFYQGTPPKNAAIKSSGLGLTIVKELLLRLNGEISLQSQTESPSGTEMKITLHSVSTGEK